MLYLPTTLLAQSGTACENAIAGKQECSNTIYTISGQQFWYKFKAESEGIRINLENPQNGNYFPHVQRMTVYEGSQCGEWIEKTTVVNESTAENITSIDIQNTIIGKWYYFQIVQSSDEQGRYTDGDFKFCVLNFQNPVLDAGPDQTICLGQRTTLTACCFPDTENYYWSDGQTGNNIIVVPINTTTYTVTYSNNNFIAIDEVVIYVINNSLPSTFSIIGFNNTCNGLTHYNLDFPNNSSLIYQYSTDGVNYTTFSNNNFSIDWNTQPNSGFLHVKIISNGCEKIVSMKMNCCCVIEGAVKWNNETWTATNNVSSLPMPPLYGNLTINGTLDLKYTNDDVENYDLLSGIR